MQLRVGAEGVRTVTGSGVVSRVRGVRAIGSRQSQAAQVPKNSRSRAAGDRSAASRTVRAASTAQATPGSPPNGAESSPRARAHAFTSRVSRTNAACRSEPAKSRTASASLTELSAIAAASPSSARSATACAGSTAPVVTTTRSTSSPAVRSRSPGTRAPFTSRSPSASGRAAATRSRTSAIPTVPGRAATRSRSAPGRAQPMRRDPARCSTPSPSACAIRAVRDPASASRADAATGSASRSGPGSGSRAHRHLPVPSSTVARTCIGPSPRRDSTASSPTRADAPAPDPPSRAVNSACARCGSRLRPSVRCGVKPSRPRHPGNRSASPRRSCCHGASPAAAGSSHSVASSRCPKLCTPATRAVNGGVCAATSASSGSASSNEDSGTKPNSRFTCAGQRWTAGSCSRRSSSTAGSCGGSHATAVRAVDRTSSAARPASRSAKSTTASTPKWSEMNSPCGPGVSPRKAASRTRAPAERSSTRSSRAARPDSEPTAASGLAAGSKVGVASCAPCTSLQVSRMPSAAAGPCGPERPSLKSPSSTASASMPLKPSAIRASSTLRRPAPFSV